MNVKCEVKLPETKEGNYGIALRNFKVEWVNLPTEKDSRGCLNANLIYISGEYGVVKFSNGILLRLPVEYIRLLE